VATFPIKILHAILSLMFHLKGNPNNNTWTPFSHKMTEPIAILNSCSHTPCCSWCTAWNRYSRNFSCYVTQWALVTNTSCVLKFCYQFVVLFSTSLQG
jgi:hypothetical protein